MTVTLSESRAWCKSLARRTARNFYFSFLTLPADQARDMCALYAFMRVCDDLGDEESIPIVRRAEQLDEWRASLDAALGGGAPEHPVFPALADVVSRYSIPSECLFAVIDGVRSDLEPTQFQTFDELSEYCYHVAGAVGICCIHVWGFHDKRAVDAAIECGLAFQLTNILRDLGDDSRAGRFYIPNEDLARFDYTRDDIRERVRNTHFEQLMRFEVERAREHYRRAERLFDYLERPGKPALAAMMKIYGGLLDRIERQGYNVYQSRIRIGAPRKLFIALTSLLRYRW